MRFFTFCSLLAAAPAILSLGCTGPQPEGTGTPATTSAPRDTSPEVAGGDEAALVAGNTVFAFDLYHGLSGADTTGNLFYSPYSVSLALAMTYAGAAGNTATQMASALQFTLPASRLGPAFDALDLAIQAKPAGATGASGQPFAINLADSLWGDQRVTFQQAFVDTLAADYGASMHTVDFVDQPAPAEADINNWVAGKTDDKIDPLLGPGAITSATRFVIVNAVYFNASWANSFAAQLTRPGTFTRADGSTVQTPMMSSPGVARAYAKGASWQAAELPYSGDTTSMVVVLPDEGAYAAVEQGLSGAFFTSVTAALAPMPQILLHMPSFTIHGPTVSLVAPLSALGMVDAFDPSADFSAMIPAGGIYISNVLHQAFVDVDESGTEAAAATAVIGDIDGVAVASVSMSLDRPFFFFIRDRATNAVLFVGREGDPTAQ
jgi:serpin B